MKDLAILMPCWKSPELLKVSIPSLLKSTKSKYEIIVILNEADPESIMYLDELKIKHINLEDNIGPSAVDYAIPYIKENNFQYIANVNSDMIFSDNWDIKLIELLEKNYPCSTSCCLIEAINGGQQIYDVYDFFKEDSHDRFNESVLNGKYKTNIETSYNHPIMCKTIDFLNVNGYSENLDQSWIDLKGRTLDDYFAYRLLKLHNDNFKFLKSNEAFVYHGESLNYKKFNLSRGDSNTANVFLTKTGISIKEFYNILNI